MKEDQEAKCYTCPYSICEYNKSCKIAGHKFKNKYRKLNNYVYENLTKFGNTIIGHSVVDVLGVAGIRDDLRKNGYGNIKIDLKQDNSVIVKAVLI